MRSPPGWRPDPRAPSAGGVRRSRCRPSLLWPQSPPLSGRNPSPKGWRPRSRPPALCALGTNRAVVHFGQSGRVQGVRAFDALPEEPEEELVAGIPLGWRQGGAFRPWKTLGSIAPAASSQPAASSLDNRVGAARFSRLMINIKGCSPDLPCSPRHRPHWGGLPWWRCSGCGSAARPLWPVRWCRPIVPAIRLGGVARPCGDRRGATATGAVPPAARLGRPGGDTGAVFDPGVGVAGAAEAVIGIAGGTFGDRGDGGLRCGGGGSGLSGRPVAAGRLPAGVSGRQ